MTLSKEHRTSLRKAMVEYVRSIKASVALSREMEDLERQLQQKRSEAVGVEARVDEARAEADSIIRLVDNTEENIAEVKKILEKPLGEAQVLILGIGLDADEEGEPA